MDEQILPPFSLSTAYAEQPASTAYRDAFGRLEQSDPRGALAVIEPVLAAEPDDVGMLSLRAWAYFQTAQLTRAEADLSRLVEADPTDVWARFALGRVLERQSRHGEALPHVRLAAAMSGDPEHELGVLRVERKIAERGSGYDELD